LNDDDDEKEDRERRYSNADTENSFIQTLKHVNTKWNILRYVFVFKSLMTKYIKIQIEKSKDILLYKY